MPVSTVSRNIVELEDQFGVRLLERSTRQLRLTDIGADILAYAQKSIEINESILSLTSHQYSEVKGIIRLSVLPSISDTLLAPLIVGFQKIYPSVHIHSQITDRRVDHIAEGFDLVFRIGPFEDSSIISKKVLSYRHQLLATPSYVESSEPIEEPKDLHQYHLLSFSSWKQKYTWTFLKGKSNEKITFISYIAMNDYNGLVG
jgi:DNA-binding transcriptional LysR family regulator